MEQTEALYELFLKYPRISTDSRAAAKDSIFVALRGDNFDGNDYAAGALEAGAAIAVIDNPAKAVSDRYFLVEDTLTALQRLAAHHRAQLGLPIVAITGSNGKTTTKELANRVLSTKFRTVVTEGNLNNHIGVPLTLLRMNGHTQIGIVEMGANHRGEIALLCSIARPDYGLITNIGQAHLEGFGGPDGVKEGKGELFDYLLENRGTAIYPPDDPALSGMVTHRSGLKAIPYPSVSLAPGASGGFIAVSASGSSTVAEPGRITRTQLVGEYNLPNVAAALAIGTLFGIGTDDMAAAIEGYAPNNNRSQKKETKHNDLILDAYNANPSSMLAALDNFTKHPHRLPKAVILGDMLELGAYSGAGHRAIVEAIEAAGIPEAFLVGEHFTLLIPPGQTIQRKNTRFHAFADVGHMADYLQAHPLRNHHILIKGSRGIRLEKIVPLL